VAWRLKYGGDYKIVNYYLSLSQEIINLQKKETKSRQPRKFDFLFHKNNLNQIYEFREYDYDKKGYLPGYVTIPIKRMNELFD